MGIESVLLGLFPIVFLTVSLSGVKIEKGKSFRSDFWDVTDAKNLEAIAACFIVLHHLTQKVSDYGRIEKGPINGMNSVGIFFTSVFFFFSGYGLYRSYQQKPGYLNTFFQKRIMKLCIPFVLTNWIYAIFMAAFSDRVPRFFDFCTSLMGFTLMNTNAWFMVEIILLSLCFYVAFQRCKSERAAIRTITIFASLMVLVGLLSGHDTSRVNGHWFLGEWWYNTTLLFPIGIAVARHKERLCTIFERYYGRLLVSSLLLFAMFHLGNEAVSFDGGYYWEGKIGFFIRLISLLIQVTASILFILLLLLVTMKCCIDNKFLRGVGTISLELYLIHGLFLHYLSREYYESDVLYFLFAIGYSALAAVLLHVAIVHLYEWYEIWNRERREVKENGYQTYSYEKKKRVKAHMLAGRIVSLLCILICVATLVSGVYEAYQYYIVDKRYFEQEMQLLANAQVGDTVSFGGLNINTETLQREAVTWYVAQKEDQRLLLVCDYAIPYYYHQQKKSVTYETAMVRDVLKEGIYNLLFDDYEREKILVDEETHDQLFLLSAKQAGELLDEKHMVVRELAALDSRVYYYNDKEAYIWWWLRDTNEEKEKAWVVRKEGTIDRDGEYVSKASGGVRPAIWVSVK